MSMLVGEDGVEEREGDVELTCQLIYRAVKERLEFWFLSVTEGIEIGVPAVAAWALWDLELAMEALSRFHARSSSPALRYLRGQQTV